MPQAKTVTFIETTIANMATGLYTFLLKSFLASEVTLALAKRSYGIRILRNIEICNLTALQFYFFSK